MADKQGLPEDTHTEGNSKVFPTEDLPGTAHPNPPATDQHGIKGMDPKSETGSQSESKAPAGTPGVEPLSKRD